MERKLWFYTRDATTVNRKTIFLAAAAAALLFTRPMRSAEIHNTLFALRFLVKIFVCAVRTGPNKSVAVCPFLTWTLLWMINVCKCACLYEFANNRIYIIIHFQGILVFNNRSYLKRLYNLFISCGFQISCLRKVTEYYNNCSIIIVVTLF